jgi:hypothetical protein
MFPVVPAVTRSSPSSGTVVQYWFPILELIVVNTVCLGPVAFLQLTSVQSVGSATTHITVSFFSIFLTIMYPFQKSNAYLHCLKIAFPLINVTSLLSRTTVNSYLDVRVRMRVMFLFVFYPILKRSTEPWTSEVNVTSVPLDVQSWNVLFMSILEF